MGKESGVRIAIDDDLLRGPTKAAPKSMRACALPSLLPPPSSRMRACACPSLLPPPAPSRG